MPAKRTIPTCTVGGVATKSLPLAANWVRVLAATVPESANIHDRGSRLLRICRAQQRMFALVVGADSPAIDARE